jgi:hypothetical protein
MVQHLTYVIDGVGGTNHHDRDHNHDHDHDTCRWTKTWLSKCVILDFPDSHLAQKTWKRYRNYGAPMPTGTSNTAHRHVMHTTYTDRNDVACSLSFIL